MTRWWKGKSHPRFVYYLPKIVYVADFGNDTDEYPESGTIHYPYATVAYASTKVKAGDQIRVLVAHNYPYQL
jgi:hypothetical protein